MNGKFSLEHLQHFMNKKSPYIKKKETELSETDTRNLIVSQMITVIKELSEGELNRYNELGGYCYSKIAYNNFATAISVQILNIQIASNNDEELVKSFQKLVDGNLTIDKLCQRLIGNCKKYLA